MIRPISQDLQLTQVEKTTEHILALFNILKKREEMHVISHNRQRNFEAHREFVLSHPYRYWFLVEYREKFIGTIYITKDNVIGSFIEPKHVIFLDQILAYVIELFEPLPGIPSVRNPEFTINLAPQNTSYARVVERLGGRLIQKSYAFPNDALADTDS